ncbi:Aspartate aminotransferase [Phycisphaerae bacterium RAS2]|nr:Aspartate aminotransferase [Phycisphaerae bacterium RAS2]
MKLADRVSLIEEAATLATAAKAAEMKRAGIDVVGFGAGEPDFDTPDHIKAAANRALAAGHTSYAKPTSGIPEARAAVCKKYLRDNALTYQPDQVIVTVGGKEALYLAFMALLNPGDEVLLPVPYWVSFAEQIKLCGGVVVPIVGSDATDLKITPKQVAAALTPRTKILVFNSPSNPGGFAYTPAETRAIADVLTGRNVVVFSDEMYDQLRYGDARDNLSFAAISPEWFGKTITFNAASKTHAMTGWRIGYAAGPREIIRAMAKLQTHTTSGTATFIQHALVEALTGDQSHVEARRREFEQRGRFMHERLCGLKDVTCVRPTGAFYCFPNVSGTYARLGVKSSVEFCALVLDRVHVALVPGSAFGMDTHVRLSFATDMGAITKGVERLEELVGRE